MLDTTVLTVKTERDVLILSVNGLYLVIGCDSAGAVGPYPLDQVKASGYLVGRLTARVALLEVVCTGATPVAVTDTLSVGGDVAEQFILGVLDEASEAGVPRDRITGSYEKNFKPVQTGVGVTAIGISTVKPRVGCSKPGDLLLLIGNPTTGEEVVEMYGKGLLPTVNLAKKLMGIRGVREVIPVGSRGVKHETWVLATDSSCKPVLKEEPVIFKSAGPSTALLASVSPDVVEEVRKVVNLPVRVVGRLETWVRS